MKIWNQNLKNAIGKTDEVENEWFWPLLYLQKKAKNKKKTVTLFTMNDGKLEIVKKELSVSCPKLGGTCKYNGQPLDVEHAKGISLKDKKLLVKRLTFAKNHAFIQ